MRTIRDRFDDDGMTDAPRTPGTVAVPGAVLSFDVVGDLADATRDNPPLVLGGPPMDSTGFGSLAARLDGRVLVLTDPRNTGRSTRDDETAAVTNLDAAVSLVTQLRQFGCRITLDDFGSGFGSFVHLKHLPITGIKIDGEFVKGIETNDADAVLVSGIVQITTSASPRLPSRSESDQPRLNPVTLQAKGCSNS